MDECASPEANECDTNALCTNTDGSYICGCLSGYQGDGRNCTGKYFSSYFIGVDLKSSLFVYNHFHLSSLHQMSMNVQVLKQMSVTPTRLVQTQKDPTFVVVWVDIREMEETAQVNTVFLLVVLFCGQDTRIYVR